MYMSYMIHTYRIPVHTRSKINYKTVNTNASAT